MSNSHAHLHILPSKLPGESQTAHIWRVAVANGFNPRKFANWLFPERWRSGAMPPGGWTPSLQRLRQDILGADGEDALKMDRRDTRSVCPACLAAGRGVLMAFQCSKYDYCVEHQCKLLSACPSCAMTLKWFHGSPAHCKCGAHLAYANTAHVSPQEFELFCAVFENRELRFDYEMYSCVLRNPCNLEDLRSIADRLSDTFQKCSCAYLVSGTSSSRENICASLRANPNSWADLAFSFSPWPSAFLRAAVHIRLGHHNKDDSIQPICKWGALDRAFKQLAQCEEETIAIFGELRENVDSNVVRSWFSPGKIETLSTSSSLNVIGGDWSAYVDSGFTPKFHAVRKHSPAFLELDALRYFHRVAPNGNLKLTSAPQIIGLAMIEATAYGFIAPIVPIDMQFWRFDNRQIRNFIAAIESRLKSTGDAMCETVSPVSKFRFRPPFTFEVLHILSRSSAPGNKRGAIDVKSRGAGYSIQHPTGDLAQHVVERAWEIHKRLLREFEPKSRWQQDATKVARAYLQWEDDLVNPEHRGKTPKVRYTTDVLSPCPHTYT